jgi:uncharacterized RDD family membrane protein YckC
MSSLNYQGIGPRLVAQIIDGIILMIINWMLGAAMFGGFTFEVFGFAALSFMGVGMLLFLVYFIVLEGMFGATVGKLVVKLKVVREDGSTCGIGPAVIRNVLRIVDALPFFYLIGLILISRSDKKQRLGDSIAKTVVVKSSRAQPIAAPAPAREFCANCGAEVPGGTKFCPKCGAKQ